MSQNQSSSPKPTQWILNAFTLSSPTHVAPGLWAYPGNRTAHYNDIDYWVDLAKLAEEAKFHAVFIADVIGHYDVYRGGNIDAGLSGVAQFPAQDPFVSISAMAVATKSVTFGVTASTTYENPYLLARRLASLDHVTKGRIGWNIVTSHLESAARNVGLETQVEHDERYRMADEHLTVVYKLLEGSWREDAVTRDMTARQYTVPGRVRPIDHKGKYFKSAGPLNVHPSIQRTPLLFQAGTSGAGKAFATKHAECIFLSGLDPKLVKKSVDSIKTQAADQGRDASSIKTVFGVLVIVDESDEKALERYQEYLSYADWEASLTLFSGWTGTDMANFDDDENFRFTAPPAVQSMVNSWTATIPGTDGVKWTKKRIAQELALGGYHPRLIGSAKTVADLLQRWVDDTGVDGFNLAYAVNPVDYHAVIKWLMPELRARGVFWEDYVSSTARENFFQDGKGPRLREDHPGHKFAWSAESS